jgi:DNA-binding transcriptional LysR family regulator
MVGVSDFDLRLLRVFVAVAEAGSFTAAQMVLNLGQSTISNQMAALEQRLGYRLCERGRSGFRLTDKGQIVYDSARNLLGAGEAYRARISALRNSLAGEIRLGIVDNTVTDANAPLTEAFRRFNQRTHDVQFHITMDAPSALAAAVLDGKLDAAIASFPRLVEGLRARKLYDEPNGFYCGHLHPLFKRAEAEITLPEIRKHRIIARGYWHMEDIYQLGLRRADAVVFQMEPVLIMLLSGAYLGFLPDHYAAHWVRKGELRCLLPSTAKTAAPFHLVTRKGPAVSPPLEMFIADILAAKRAADHI